MWLKSVDPSIKQASSKSLFMGESHFPLKNTIRKDKERVPVLNYIIGQII